MHFNPRTRMGCDVGCIGCPMSGNDFNPRTRMGCDLLGSVITVWASGFQSTHPHGVRHSSSDTCGLLPLYFNPRTRMGCDAVSGSKLQYCSIISIHAPAWGATTAQIVTGGYSKYFNPRTRMGCDPFDSPDYIYELISIHAPAWGATSHTAFSFPGGAGFQSTHPHGVRPILSLRHSWGGRFHLAFAVRSRSKNIVLVIGSINDGKPTLTVALGDDIVAQGVNAGVVVREAEEAVTASDISARIPG